MEKQKQDQKICIVGRLQCRFRGGLPSTQYVRIATYDNEAVMLLYATMKLAAQLCPPVA